MPQWDSISVLVRAKTVRALDRAATAIGIGQNVDVFVANFRSVL
jgi:hypothetical protein